MTKRCGLGKRLDKTLEQTKQLSYTEVRGAGVGKPNIIAGLESPG